MFNMGCLKYQNGERSLSECKGEGRDGGPRAEEGWDAGLRDPSESWVLVGRA